MPAQRLYTIPKREWERLMARFDAEDAISEDEAANLLGVKRVTLQVARSRGTIPPDCYTIPKVGRPVYFKSKLLNLNY